MISTQGIHFINWPGHNVLALQTSRTAPQDVCKDIRENLSGFQFFNLGLHVNDEPHRVIENRSSLTKILSQHTLNPELSIQWLNQVHGDEVVTIKQVTNELISADASITCEKGIALAIMTADCLPILLSSRKGTEIAAIHGGWRPLAANIIEKTLAKMQVNSSEIIAWLGPCIGKTAFEVGMDVYSSFVNQSTAFDSAFQSIGNKKFLADLHQIAKIQLRQQGVTHIMQLSECTYTLTDKYFSYRRESITGRMATLIAIK